MLKWKAAEVTQLTRLEAEEEKERREEGARKHT
jgi:hypothetical protein